MCLFRERARARARARKKIGHGLGLVHVRIMNALGIKKRKTVSRILSSGLHQEATIHLGTLSPKSSSDYCEINALEISSLTVLASDRVCHALSCLKCSKRLTLAFQPVCSYLQRIVFCYTFRSLAAPSVSLVSSPMKSRLSSPAVECSSGCSSSLKLYFRSWTAAASCRRLFCHCGIHDVILPEVNA